MANKSKRTRPSVTKKKTSSGTYYIVTVVIVVLIAMVAMVAFALSKSSDTAGQVGAIPSNATDSYGMALGNPDAAAKVVIYEDFQCPYCDEFENAGRTPLAQAESDGRAYVVYYPIAFLDRASTTNYSTRALNAFGVVLDASGVQVADKFHDLLYENQPAEGSAGLSDDQLINLAVQAGADKVTISNRIRNLVFQQWTVNATDQASQAGITGTPTVMVNGKKVDGNSMQELVANVMAEIDLAQPSSSTSAPASPTPSQ